MGGVLFLHSAFLRPSGKDLRFMLIANCQSGVVNKTHLKELLGGTCRIEEDLLGTLWRAKS